MTQSDEWIISVDDHVIEPPHTWQSRLPSRLKEVGPRVAVRNGSDTWLYEDKAISVNGLVTQAGWEKQDLSPLPVSYGDMRASCYDPAARIVDMDADGVLASLCFPNLPRFCGQLFMEGRDRELGRLCIEAYNDFMLEEWCGVEPGRFIPAIIIPLWDPTLAAKEIERCAALGALVVSFSENPADLGLPSIHDPSRFWDPAFRAVEDAGMTLGIHIGSSSRKPEAMPFAPPTIPSALMGWRSATTCMEWIFSDVFIRFPRLRITLSEGGIGWIPMALDRADYSFTKNRAWADRYEYHKDMTITDLGPDSTHWPYEDLLPSDIFRAHVRGCYIPTQDTFASETIRQLGAEYVLAETDFPHADSSFPTTGKLLSQQLGSLSDDDQLAVRRGNAEAWYRFTPAQPRSLSSAT